MTWSSGSASISAASKRSVSKDKTPRQPASLARRTSGGAGNWFVQISASQALLTLSNPASGITRVTRTFGFAIRRSFYGLPGGGLGPPGGLWPGGRGGVVGFGGCAAGFGGGAGFGLAWGGRRSGTGGRGSGAGRGVRTGGGGLRDVPPLFAAPAVDSPGFLPT